jgi:hypothetical protein
MISKNKIVASLSFLGSLISTSVFAAADADVLAAGSSAATTIKENVMGVLTANIPVILIAGVFILSVMVIWRMGKRFVR